MHKVLVAGAGKIGSLVTYLLLDSGSYEVWLADLDFSGADHGRLTDHPHLHKAKINVQNESEVESFLKDNPVTTVISSLPYFCNADVAKMARKFGLNYFDLTEDTEVTKQVKALAQDAQNAFVPQCGLAPGFVSIVANSLIQNFTQIDAVRMRVGALPVNANNALQYSLTWSTDGLINEYGNLGHAIERGQLISTQPLEGLEHIEIDGTSYEAFNTSGGLGSLAELYVDKINTMNYKTIRYPGHCAKMRLLMNDLKLNQDRDTLKRILENAVPKTYQDVVIVYVSVIGIQNSELIEENYVTKVYPHRLGEHHWSAIQVTTAAGICGVVDIILSEPEAYRGFVFQENIELSVFLKNRFGRFYNK